MVIYLIASNFPIALSPIFFCSPKLHIEVEDCPTKVKLEISKQNIEVKTFSNSFSRLVLWFIVASLALKILS